MGRDGLFLMSLFALGDKPVINQSKGNYTRQAMFSVPANSAFLERNSSDF